MQVAHKSWGARAHGVVRDNDLWCGAPFPKLFHETWFGSTMGSKTGSLRKIGQQIGHILGHSSNYSLDFSTLQQIVIGHCADMAGPVTIGDPIGLIHQ